MRPGYSGKDGRWLGVSARCRVIVYNTDMVNKDELPSSVLDMATEKWKGRVAFVPTSGSFQEQIIAIKLTKGRQAALDWLKGLKKYGVVYNGNTAAMKAVEHGNVANGMVKKYYWFAVDNDRKSGGEGKSMSVRVVQVGRLIIKKKRL